jgi:hypothetical protein
MVCLTNKDRHAVRAAFGYSPLLVSHVVPHKPLLDAPTVGIGQNTHSVRDEEWVLPFGQIEHCVSYAPFSGLIRPFGQLLQSPAVPRNAVLPVKGSNSAPPHNNVSPVSAVYL